MSNSKDVDGMTFEQKVRRVVSRGHAKVPEDVMIAILNHHKNFTDLARTEAKREVWDDIFARMSDGELEMTLSGKVAERLTPKLVEIFPELKENR